MALLPSPEKLGVPASGGDESAESLPEASDEELRRVAWRIRRRALEMVAREGFGYLGQALSAAEIFAVLYRDAIHFGRDRLVVSPGHYAIAHYAAAAELGLLQDSNLADYGVDGALLESIGTETTPALDATCGSLGQGLSVAAGLALADKIDGGSARTFAFVSDGEMEEGQLWEAAMFAAHQQLGNLTVVLDRNDSQVDGPTHTVTTLEPVQDKWTAFGWNAVTVDGHDVSAIRKEVGNSMTATRPTVIIARTWTLSGLADVLPDEADGHFLKVGPDELDRSRRELDIAEAESRVVGPAPWTVTTSGAAR